MSAKIPGALAPVVDVLEQILLADLPIPKSLQDIFAQFSISGDARGAIINALERRLSGQTLRSTLTLVAHALTKQIDATIDNPQLGQLTIEQKRQIADALARNVATQLIHTAQLIVLYPALQEAVVQCKEHPDAHTPTQLDQVRRARDGAQGHIQDALVNVGRVIVGDSPVSETTNAPH